MSLETEFAELEIMSKVMQLELMKGESDFSDEKIQFFLPVVLHFTNFDWLEIVAKNILVEEDEKVVLNFLEQVKALLKVNEQGLTNAVEDKINDLMRDL